MKTGEMLPKQWTVEAGFLLNSNKVSTRWESFSNPGPATTCIFTKSQPVWRQVTPPKSWLRADVLNNGQGEGEGDAGGWEAEWNQLWGFF